MSKSLYKYVGPSNFHKIFGLKKHVSLKCSYPKDFNDPFELFLTIDFNQHPDIIAFYAEAVGALPQLPTTCFSRSPTVVPMWAHYAQNCEGFVIEFDEEKLRASFPESAFGNVDYRDTPHEALTEMLYRASEIGKPRYVYLLQNWVFRSAYYTKTNCWSYEQERRMVLDESEVKKIDNLVLFEVPANSIKSIICGPRARPDLISALAEKAGELQCAFFSLKIGKTNILPYLKDQLNNTFEFDGNEIVSCTSFCSSCHEPITQDSNSCSWCLIDDSHRQSAARRNPYRLYDHYGLLDSYIKGMDAISRRHTKN